MSRSILIAAAALSFAVVSPVAGAPSRVPPQTAAGPDFLARNSAAKGVVTTPSGLEYFVVKSGAAKGSHPAAEDSVTFDYDVRLLTGEAVDSSYANGKPLTGKVG